MIKGKVHKFRDNVNTDEIIPAKYLNTSDPKELGSHCMTGIDEEFPQRASAGDIIVAGKNFGCGSSREHAPISIKGLGISCVIAESFARIFYRNAINIGLPILESAKASREAKEGDTFEMDYHNGTITNVTRNKKYHATPFPEFMEDLIKQGGLINWVKHIK